MERSVSGSAESARAVSSPGMFTRLWRAQGQSRAAKTVEAFGWLILFEGVSIVLAPHFIASLLHLPALAEQAANYFRLAGVLVSGIGMLYVVSGRLNAEGFVFASLLDRPLVPLSHGGAVVSRHHSRPVGIGVLGSGLRQLPLDARRVARGAGVRRLARPVGQDDSKARHRCSARPVQRLVSAALG